MKEWKGQAHRFEIKTCEVVYNGKPFFLGATLAELKEIFGAAPDRQKGFVYGWSELGVSVVKEDNSTKVEKIIFHLNDGVSEIMDRNDQVVLLYTLPIRSDQLIGNYLQPLSKLFGKIYVLENNHEIRIGNCNGHGTVCNIDSPTNYDIEPAGHFKKPKEYNPTVTYPVDVISIYRSSE